MEITGRGGPVGAPDHRPTTSDMKRIIGMTIGVVWLGFSWLTLQRALGGWEMGHDDVGLWWAIITGLLTIAALGALVGTWIHTRPREG